MPIIPSGFAQANFRFSGFAIPRGAEITLGLDLADFVTPSPTVVANAVADAFTPHVMPSVCADVRLDEVYVKFGPNDTGASGSAFRSVAGTRVQEVVPPNTSLLIRKTTAGGGRRARGRFYMPGAPENQVQSTGVLTTTYLNDVAVAWDSFFDELGTVLLQPVVLHAAGISATPAPTEIVAFEAQGLVATQRDRLR